MLFKFIFFIINACFKGHKTKIKYSILYKLNINKNYIIILIEYSKINYLKFLTDKN